MKKIKIIVTLMIMIIGLLICNKVNAATTSKVRTGEAINSGLASNFYYVADRQVFCVYHGKDLKDGSTAIKVNEYEIPGAGKNKSISDTKMAYAIWYYYTNNGQSTPPYAKGSVAKDTGLHDSLKKLQYIIWGYYADNAIKYAANDKERLNTYTKDLGMGQPGKVEIKSNDTSVDKSISKRTVNGEEWTVVGPFMLEIKNGEVLFVEGETKITYNGNNGVKTVNATICYGDGVIRGAKQTSGEFNGKYVATYDENTDISQGVYFRFKTTDVVTDIQKFLLNYKNYSYKVRVIEYETSKDKKSMQGLIEIFPERLINSLTLELNVPKIDTSITIYKHEKGNKNVAVKDAVFSVEKETGFTYPTGFSFTNKYGLKTGTDGKILAIEGLVPGKYSFIITETETNQQYVLENPMKIKLTFTVEDNKKISNYNVTPMSGVPAGMNPTFSAGTTGRLGLLEWPNELKDSHKLILKKVSMPTGTNLPNVFFAITVKKQGSSGNPLKTFSGYTNTNGEITLSVMFPEAGNYEINVSETCPTGHMLPNGNTSGTYTFTIIVTVDANGNFVGEPTSSVNNSNIIPSKLANGIDIQIVVQNEAIIVPSSGDISGIVWEDRRLGKTQEANGKYDLGEYPISGVKVELWSSAIGKCTETVTENGTYSFKIEPEYCADPTNRSSSVNGHDSAYLTTPVETEFYVKFYYDGLEYTVTPGKETLEPYNKATENSAERQSVITDRYKDMGPGEGDKGNNTISATANTHGGTGRIVAYKHLKYSASTKYTCVSKGSSAPSRTSLASYPDRAYNVSYYGQCHENCGGYDYNGDYSSGHTKDFHSDNSSSCTSYDKVCKGHSCWGHWDSDEGKLVTDPDCRDYHSDNSSSCTSYDKVCKGHSCWGHWNDYKYCPTRCHDKYSYTYETWTVDKVTKDTAGTTTTFEYKNVNMGLVRRDKLDLELMKDIDSVELSINGQSSKYTAGYGQVTSIDSGRGTQGNNETELQFFESDNGKYNLKINEGNINDIVYTKPVLPTDYGYRADGQTVDKYGNAYPYRDISNTTNLSKELRVFINYKIVVRNNSPRLQGKITELVDYYDNTLTPVKVYTDANPGGVSINNATSSGTNGFDKLYINSSNASELVNTTLAPGQTKTVYVQFEVKKDDLNNRAIILGEKDNFVEINRYSTNVSANGVMIGQIDVDSTPGNYNPNMGKGGTYQEDDTFAAPTISIFLESSNPEGRSITGKVWEENKWMANGIKDAGEAYIPGMRVELVEKFADGTEFVWGTGKANEKITTPVRVSKYENGIIRYTDGTTELLADVYSEGSAIENNDNYKFYGFIPGNYEVRFVYGSIGEDNNATYKNGYTSEQLDVVYGKDYPNTQIEGEIPSKSSKSGCSDEYIEKITNSAKNGKGVNNPLDYTGQDYEATVLGTNSKAQDNSYRRTKLNETFGKISNDFGNLLALTSETRTAELLTKTWMEASANQTVQLNSGKITDIGLGIKERDSFNVQVDKVIEKIVLKQNNGDILLDARLNSVGVLINEPNTLIKVPEIFDELFNEVEANSSGGKFYDVSQVRAELEEYLMGGAQLEVTYGIILENIGDVSGTINKVVDYVDNDIRFADQTSPAKWKDMKLNDVDTYRKYIDPRIISGLEQKVLAVNEDNISVSRMAKEKTQIYLSKTLDVTATTDDMLYKNVAEILEYSNGQGRRNYAGIPGNQATNTDREYDADMATVSVTPPLGAGEENNILMYVMAGMAVVLLTGVSIFTIRGIRKNK